MSKGMWSPRHSAIPEITVGQHVLGGGAGEKGGGKEWALDWVVKDAEEFAGLGKAFQMEGPAKAKARRSEKIWSVQRLSRSLGGEEALGQGREKHSRYPRVTLWVTLSHKTLSLAINFPI